jgi:hypothetical protein
MRDLTAAEIQELNEHKRCPICHNGELLEGPHGGACVNVRCYNCGQELNITLFIDGVVSGHTLDRNAPEAYHGPLDVAAILAEHAQERERCIAEYKQAQAEREQ